MRNLLNEDDDITMLAISIDAADKGKMLKGKIEKDGKGELKFPLLSDPGHKTIDIYGLIDEKYIGKGFEGIPKPAIYILDENRKVLWAKIESDYRERPTIEEIRSALDKLKTGDSEK